jgi:hypothetical protein
MGKPYVQKLGIIGRTGYSTPSENDSTIKVGLSVVVVGKEFTNDKI